MLLSIKIVSSVGPASASMPVIKEMITHGMNCARIASSYADGDVDFIGHIREASEALSVPVAIMHDIASETLFIGSLPGGRLVLEEGKFVRFHSGVISSDAGVVPVPYERFASELKKGDQLLLALGTLELEVFDVQGNMAVAKVVRGGVLASHKDIAVPTKVLSYEYMTEADEARLAHVLKQGVDFISSSFIRSAQDARDMRESVMRHMPKDKERPCVLAIIDKNETALNIEEILPEVDGILVSEHIPAQELLMLTRRAGKIAIVEMRVHDAAHAQTALEQVDAVAITDKPSANKYPSTIVQEMARAISHIHAAPLHPTFPSEESVASAVAASAVFLARAVDAAAILVTTGSGYSAQQLVRFRPEIPVYAATPSLAIERQLLALWGTTPFIASDYTSPEHMLVEAFEILSKKMSLPQGSKIVIMSGLTQDANTGYDSSIRVREV